MSNSMFETKIYLKRELEQEEATWLHINELSNALKSGSLGNDLAKEVLLMGLAQIPPFTLGTVISMAGGAVLGKNRSGSRKADLICDYIKDINCIDEGITGVIIEERFTTNMAGEIIEVKLIDIDCYCLEFMTTNRS